MLGVGSRVDSHLPVWELCEMLGDEYFPRDPSRLPYAARFSVGTILDRLSFSSTRDGWRKSLSLDNRHETSDLD